MSATRSSSRDIRATLVLPPRPRFRRAGHGSAGTARGPRGAWLLAACLTLLALLLVAGRPALAQTNQGERAFVYGINAAVPGSFTGTFAPPTAGTIYLLAGETSVISPRYTEIYFWPITNEYLANWNLLNEPVAGTLEVLRGGNVVAEIEATDYTIHFRHDAQALSSAELFLGEEAIAAEEEFRARQKAFQEASTAYYKAEREWMAAVADANARSQAGEEVTIPPEPKRPDPIGVFSNGLNQGMPIDLEPGSYTIRLRGEDGEIVPGSERGLEMFTARRTGVGYTVVPETRWTTPDESPAPGDIILGAAASTIFLEPHQAREYPARSWALLQNPQRAAGDVGGWEWVNGEQIGSGRLDVAAGDQVTQVALTPFRVKQMPGAQLGYEVLPADAPEAQPPPGAEPRNPDFAAFPIELGGSGEQVQIEMWSDEDAAMSGSQRLVRVPHNPPITRLFVLPVVPLVLGGIMLSRRRRPVRLSREIAG